MPSSLQATNRFIIAKLNSLLKKMQLPDFGKLLKWKFMQTFTSLMKLFNFKLMH